MAALSDEQLAAKTGELRQRLEEAGLAADEDGSPGSSSGTSTGSSGSSRRRPGQHKQLLGGMPEDVVVEAFAVVKEAAQRVLGMRHYDVQLVRGLPVMWGSRPVGSECPACRGPSAYAWPTEFTCIITATNMYPCPCTPAAGRPRPARGPGGRDGHRGGQDTGGLPARLPQRSHRSEECRRGVNDGCWLVGDMGPPLCMPYAGS